MLKYWSRVSGNRWLIAKMFGVLVSGLALTSMQTAILTPGPDGILPTLGVDRRVAGHCALFLFFVQHIFLLSTCGGVSIDYRMVNVRNRDSTHRFGHVHVVGLEVFVDLYRLDGSVEHCWESDGSRRHTCDISLLKTPFLMLNESYSHDPVPAPLSTCIHEARG